MRSFSYLIFGSLLLGALWIPSGEVSAKSVTWNTTNVPELFYFWNNQGYWPDSYNNRGLEWGAAYMVGLRPGANVSVTYDAYLENADTGALIADGATLPDGTRVRVVWDRQDSDISWFGTGATQDSPFGTWVPSAGDPVHTNDDPPCNRFYVNNTGWATYIPFSVNPPSMTLAGNGVSCSSDVCTVTGAGPKTITATFPDTFGKFYYRYYEYRRHINTNEILGCTLHVDYPMRTCTQAGSFSNHRACGGYYFGALQLPNKTEPYALDIPEQQLTFTVLSAGADNAAPNVPNITPQPFSGARGVSHSFTFQAWDIDNDQVRYHIDWTNDGSVDLVTDFVDSGDTVTTPFAWNEVGAHNFQVRTEDARGGLSDWRSAAVTIVAPSTPTVFTEPASAVSDVGLTLNGAVNPNGNTAVAWFRYGTTDPGSCTDTFGSKVPVAGFGVGDGDSEVLVSQPLVGLSAGVTYYYCAIAESSGGKTYGTVRTVMTSPTTPSNLSVVPGACDSDHVTLTWDPVPGATTYSIYDGTNEVYVGSLNSFVHVGLVPASLHGYTVVARNVAGDSAPSNPVNEVASSACIAPPAVTFDADRPMVNSGDFVTLTWKVAGLVDSCAASGDWTNVPPKSTAGGTETIASIVADKTFGLECTGPGGSSGVKTVNVSVNDVTNLTGNVGLIAPSAFNGATGFYDSITIQYSVMNNGSRDVAATTLRFVVDVNNDGSVDDTINVPIDPLTAGESTTAKLQVLATDVLPGSAHKVTVLVDATDVVPEADEADNQFVRTGPVLPYPDPGINISVSPSGVVRSGSLVDVHWDIGVGATYLAQCVVVGSSLPQRIVWSSGDLNTAASISDVGPILSHSQFILKCIAPDSTSYTDTAEVRTLGTSGEI